MDRVGQNIETDPLTIGVISDTHGLLRPEAADALADVQAILHAGDIGGKEILDQLERIAPVIAVRGNMDGGPWCSGLPMTEAVELGGIAFYMLHDLYRLDLDPAAAGFQVVVNGHTHQPSAVQRDGVLYLNPGSASHARNNTPAGIARLRIRKGRLSYDFVALDL